MSQINWPSAPSVQIAVTVPEPPPTDDVAVQDWMRMTKQAIDTLAAGKAEMQDFLDDLLDAVRSYQLVGNDIQDLAGTGTPEGNVTARIGSTYRRDDGGAGTSFYVKESGTGATGWVGK